MDNKAAGDVKAKTLQGVYPLLTKARKRNRHRDRYHFLDSATKNLSDSESSSKKTFKSFQRFFERLNINLFSRAIEDEELDNFVFRTQVENFVKTYSKEFKYGMVMFIALLVFLVFIHLLFGLYKTPAGMTFIVQVSWL